MKKILMASLAVGALALNAPVASAAEATGDCGFDSVQQETATGQNFEGVAYGVASDTDGDPVTIRCYITVNDNAAPAGSTPTGSGTGVATTQGTISFEAADGAIVKLCTEVNGVTLACDVSTNTQFPPQEVLDALDGVFDLITAIEIGVIDPLICPVLASLGPIDLGGVVTINEQGDVFLLGDPFWDCPPYDLFPPEG